MQPEDLFTAHVEKAEKIATSLCWRYRVSGALFYQEEAKSEARLALWRACQNFNPSRQEMELRKMHQHELAHFWNPIFGSPPPSDSDHQSPFDNFWIWAVRQIYGRVIDWFRSYHLIKRMAKDEQPSMIYHERFISMTRSKYNGVVGMAFDQNGSANTGVGGAVKQDYDECLPSKDVADGYNDVEERREKITRLVRLARLTEMEMRVLSLAFGEDELDKVEIAEQLGISVKEAGALLKSALNKLKQVAQPECKPLESLSCLTTLSMERPMLRPGI